MHLLVSYWPFWLLAGVAVLFVVVLARAAALGDELAHQALSEREAALACRPSPSPIDVEPMGPFDG